ncbi:MAG: DUF3313 family protein [Phycisphaerales bacterium]
MQLAGRIGREMSRRVIAVAMLSAALLLSGCANRPSASYTGFLSDYSRLEPVSDTRARYESGRAREYEAFIVEPIEVLTPREKLSESDREAAKRHFDSRVRLAIREAGWGVVESPGPNVGRLRIALTDVARSTWWMKLHPAAHAAGVGTGGAAMEAEVLDSVTGEQVGAVVQAATGNQFDFTAFSTLDDVKNAIDKWADIFHERLEELRAAS